MKIGSDLASAYVITFLVSFDHQGPNGTHLCLVHLDPGFTVKISDQGAGKLTNQLYFGYSVKWV